MDLNLLSIPVGGTINQRKLLIYIELPIITPHKLVHFGEQWLKITANSTTQDGASSSA